MTPTSFTDGLMELSVLDIFADDRYRIPLYQRAYAWTAAEIHTLLVDIQDARKLSQLRDDDNPQRYYIGSLVVDTSRSEDEEVHEVVDGQQRLTTLFVILSIAPGLLGVALPARAALHQEWSAFLANKLSYEGRHEAREDLRRLAQRGSGAISSLRTDAIKNAAEIVLAAISLGAVGEGPATASASAPITAPPSHRRSQPQTSGTCLTTW